MSFLPKSNYDALFNRDRGSELTRLEIIVNGENRNAPAPVTIEGLLIQLGLNSERLAVELNREVVTRSLWPTVNLKENDQIEIIHFVGGGMEKSDK